ncbi:dolichol-phosphate mannosyltransferase [Methanomicrobium sp. W14]|uniref:glycosyltransferase n=1 Tax=Methanomicrobium sp. W14 TaxID=2817839 RepID=UPI001AE743B9|nr:glycosyltransferase [Methanomicrobium sp. W14]MBP2134354.1 dolichol-phosphate mannosyltransferase [Methanomicrobium sp. W14]
MISVIVPCFNEEKNVELYNQTLFPVLMDISKRYNQVFEYIFVDDGSSDKTFQNLLKLSECHENVHICKHEKNRGLGEAINTGIKNVHGEYIVTLDSDLTYRPEDITILLDAAKESKNWDCISGSPYLYGQMTENVSFFRLFPSKSVNYLYKIFLNTNMTCFSSIFRLYRSEIFDKIHIKSKNYDVCAEIISKMLLSGMKVVEVPVKLHNREFGESKLDMKKETINNLKLLIKIFYIKLSNKCWE